MFALSANEGNEITITDNVQQASNFTGNHVINYQAMRTFSEALLKETLKQAGEGGEKPGIKLGPELEGRNRTIIRWQADVEARRRKFFKALL